MINVIRALMEKIMSIIIKKYMINVRRKNEIVRDDQKKMLEIKTKQNTVIQMRIPLMGSPVD